MVTKEIKVAMAYPAFYPSFKQFIPQLEPKITPDDVKDFDIIIFSGGEDVDPTLYGEENEGISWCNRTRDDKERAIFDVAYNLNKKIFGVCRGHQLINVLMGGTLFQDLSLSNGGPHKGVHPIKLLAMHELLSILPQAVNSMHHQGINVLAPGLYEIAGWNGIPEVCVSNTGFGNIITTQFHPEFMGTDCKRLFEWLLVVWKSKRKDTAKQDQLNKEREFFEGLAQHAATVGRQMNTATNSASRRLHEFNVAYGGTWTNSTTTQNDPEPDTGDNQP